MGYRGILLLACLFAGSASAASNDWSAVGPLPPGGFVGPIVVNPKTPSTLYAAAQKGLYESTDSGASWTRVLVTLNPATAVAIDPQSPSTLYVVASLGTGGLYKTVDGGLTWAPIDTGIAGIGSLLVDGLVEVAVDPVDEGVVYAGGINTGMYKSTDGGAHWNQINAGIITGSVTHAWVVSVVVDPVTPAVLYAIVNTSTAGSTGSTSLYKSTDNGATWIAQLGLGTILAGEVAIDPADHTHLLACFSKTAAQSTDSGATWNSVSITDTGTDMQVCAFDPSDSSHILIGSVTSLFVSSGGGAFAADPNVPANRVNGIAFDPVTPSNIYVGSLAWGVLKSSDGGATWSQSTTGIPDLGADRVLEGSDGILYMSTTQSGIYKSLDQGATWEPAGAGIGGSLPATADAVRAFAQDPATPSKLYVGTGDGLYRSSDGGDSWTLSNTGRPYPWEVDALAIDPEAPATLYAGDDGVVYKSVDGGATWAAASSGLTAPVVPLIHAIAVDPHNSGVVFAAPYGNGLFKSVDGGASWVESDTGMGKADIYSVAVDPADSNLVYVSAIMGIYKSSDGGSTWVASSAGMSAIGIFDALLIDPVDPSVLYLSPTVWAGESYVSQDAAASWQIVDSPTSLVYHCSMLIDPMNHTHLYAAGSEGNFYVQGVPATGVAAGAAVQTVIDTSVGGTLSATPAYSKVQTLKFTVVQQPAHGQVNLDPGTGNFTYAPTAGYVGTDGFSFEVTDQWGGVSDTATEQVNVADAAPVANDGSVDAPVSLSVNATLSATAYDGQTLTFRLTSHPAHGKVVLTPGTGQFTYTPAAGFVGGDSFLFQVVDQYGTPSNTATEQVTVAKVDPVANVGSVSTTPDIGISGKLSATPGFAGDVLTYSLVANPTHGTVTLNAGDGQFRYVPKSGYAGSDSFSFQVTDEAGTLSNVATVSITVNDLAPKAASAMIRATPGKSTNGTLGATKAYVGQTLTFSIVIPPTRGTVHITNPNTGAYTYTSAGRLSGTDSFTFQVMDQWGTVSTAVVKITIL